MQHRRKVLYASSIVVIVAFIGLAVWVARDSQETVEPTGKRGTSLDQAALDEINTELEELTRLSNKTRPQLFTALSTMSAKDDLFIDYVKELSLRCIDESDLFCAEKLVKTVSGKGSPTAEAVAFDTRGNVYLNLEQIEAAEKDFAEAAAIRSDNGGLSAKEQQYKEDGANE